ncbi:MAG: hypothetical protein KGL39_03675 [Patescibacteria group bacterium]|nr:hypothetical protein [Patescibacteria group bacterium]
MAARHHMKHEKREKGGLVEDRESKIDARTPRDDETMKEAEDKKDSFRKGGHVKKKKRGGMVEGEKSHHRMDKRARGGMVGGHSPMSSAMKVKGRPGGEYDGTTDKEDD